MSDFKMMLKEAVSWHRNDTEFKEGNFHCSVEYSPGRNLDLFMRFPSFMDMKKGGDELEKGGSVYKVIQKEIKPLFALLQKIDVEFDEGAGYAELALAGATPEKQGQEEAYKKKIIAALGRIAKAVKKEF